MSTRQSLILTDIDEHWYIETNSADYDVDIEIDKNSIESIDIFKSDRDTVMLTIKGNSQLAKIIKHYLINVDEDKFR